MLGLVAIQRQDAQRRQVSAGYVRHPVHLIIIKPCLIGLRFEFQMDYANLE